MIVLFVIVAFGCGVAASTTAAILSQSLSIAILITIGLMLVFVAGVAFGIAVGGATRSRYKPRPF